MATSDGTGPGSAVLAHDIVDTVDTADTVDAWSPSVLLLHSTVGDRRMWDHQVATLSSAGLGVISCDLSGYGESPPPTSAYNDAEDVLALLDHLGEESVDIVAASGGGEVATELAARWPDRVRKLLLICTAGQGHGPGEELAAFAEEEDRLLESGQFDAAVDLNLRTWVQSTVPDEVRDLVATMQRRAFEVQSSMGDVDEKEVDENELDPDRISADTLLISGGRDFVDFRTIAEKLAARIPRARHEHLDWAGHLPTLERPEEMDAVMLGFLRGG